MSPRITIARLLAAIVLIGIGLAALRTASEWWASFVFTMTLLGLALAAVHAVQRRGTRRAYWSAFVAFGAGYLVLSFGPWFEAAIRPRLLTTRVLDLADRRLTPEQPGVAPPRSFSPDGRIHPIGVADVTVRLRGPDETRRERFQTIGHCLSALVVATLGGLAARYSYDRRDERRREAAEKAAGVLLRVLEAGL